MCLGRIGWATKTVEFEINKEFFAVVRSILRIHPLALTFNVVEHRQSTSILSSTTLYTHLVDEEEMAWHC